MREITFSRLFKGIVFLYILSLYLLTFQEGLNIISNVLALFFVLGVFIDTFFIKKSIVFNKVLLYYLLFIVVCLLSLFFAVNTSKVFEKVQTLTLVFIVMFSFANYIDRVEKIKNIIKYFSISGFLASLYLFASFDFSQTRGFGSQLGNINAVGLILGVSAVFSFYIFMTEKKYLYLFFSLVMTVSILYTGSRKSLLFILINLIVWSYIRNRNKKTKFIILSFISIVLAFYIMFYIPFFYETIGIRIEYLIRFLGGEVIRDGSLEVRSYMNEVGLYLFKKRPFTGYGIDNFSVLYRTFPGGHYSYSHNNLIELMVGTGLIGVFLYYCTHFLVLKNLYKGFNRLKNHLLYPFITLIAAITIIAPTMVYYDDKHFNYLIAIASVLCKVIDTNTDEKLKVDKNHEED